ncbi:hypothetical protein E1B28_000750 [Marasmius oreades]|uniref:Cell cycle checkpoint control protein n=1 Tax=Marasmius oreades TaxID=181124 RepID=A0A9P8AEN9_9AGAR|nr:uncharacterized protein E1B28_000750 [Marasmius oreades]KAG7098847.1 hypothetical protein E1B28_000750 [Marasmius oreades]
MQVSFDSHALKPFIRALTCLSRYGEELTIYATPETLSMSCTNSSKSAYCRFRYSRQFFSKYRLGISRAGTINPEGDTVTGQLMTKGFLSILKHHFGDSSVERCDISIVEGEGNANKDEDEEDSLESRLVVRLHCKHGVVKTHRLVLMTPQSLMAPGVPDTSEETFLRIGPRAIREIIEHFPLARGIKADPQLIWSFEDTEVHVKSLESSIDSKGKAQLSTELVISADEFDVYNLEAAPITLAFHLREFNATIAFAEASSLCFDLRFTVPAAPLFIDVEGDDFEILFVISTSQVQVSPSQQTRPMPQMVKKRAREETPSDASGRFKKPMKAVHPTDRVSMARDDISSRSSIPPSSMPPVAIPIRDRRPTSRASSARDSQQGIAANPAPQINEPLFLPSTSQLSIMDEKALQESGLGIENMTVEEFNAMIADDGDEDILPQHISPSPAQLESFELIEDDPGLAPTQDGSSVDDNQSKTFHPLFED